MTDHRKPKRYKNLLSWFTSGAPSSDSVDGIRSGSGSGSRNVTENSVNDVPLNTSPSIPLEECHNERIEREESFDVSSLERDPGIRSPICKYPLNQRDNIQRAYVVLGPYPSHHPVFTEHGFQGWKNVMSKKSGVVYHMGGINSPHNIAMHKWESLRNPSKHIERVISTQSSQEIADHRLRLITTIESVRLLARQGCAFRGHDESVNSSNGGNFNAVVDSFARMNVDVRKVLQNAPGNAKYISPLIQKQILNILGNKVRIKNREEVGDAKFCILVDEAVDVSNREQMAIILRFVDCDGFIRERFFKVLSVADTCSQTLKDKISKVLTQYDLQVENMRGQGYDGASNMRGEFNGLQALFREECPYAYYVHCFAHRLQLTLNAAAKGVHDIWEFFSTLSLIVNFVDSSAKRHSALRVIREEEIANLVATGALETGRGANQTCTLQRAGATHWGSHLRSISKLDSRFTDNSLELLILSATFDPRDNFRSFKCEDVCNLALRFYPQDFTSYDMLALDMECGYFLADIQKDPRFANITTVSDLCRRLVESRKSAFFPMIYRLICLVLTLPVSTATERAFSSMTIIKNKLRNKMEDEFFGDLMVLYIEKEFADSIDNDSVIAEFELSESRRVRFS
ncbi:uncharacterized protein LOC112164050 [Rosa chinensis]|uniref:uncharacterized protein LOC112164050 n=1 Tax=Rosa chinensis TaxID=74649 RepID=UPI001AD8DAD3|nr:uncharacterized protein LOC112164050 [Rosa chinensis]